MSLSKISLNTAEKIVDIYSGLLIALPQLKKTERYGYSALAGYDLVDLFRALKLLTAQRVKTIDLVNSESLATLEKYANEDDAIIAGFDMYFVPNEIAEKLKTLDPESKDDLIESMHLRTAFITKSPMSVLIRNEETNSSFLRYCLSIDKCSQNYWPLIYKRLNLLPE